MIHSDVTEQWLWWVRQDICILYDPICIKFLNAVCSYWDRKQIRGCPELGSGDEGREEGKDYKGAGRSFDGNGNVNFLDCGDGFIGAYVCSYLSNYKL